MDFKLLQDAFEAVINSHYRGAEGRIALRLVECPAICSKALNLLSQLCPYSEGDSGKNLKCGCFLLAEQNPKMKVCTLRNAKSDYCNA